MSNASLYRWTNLTMNAPFAPRDGAGALSFDGKLWLIGGWNPRDKANFPRICSNDVWCSLDGRDWQCVKENTFADETFDPCADWEGRHTAGYVVHGGKMWIVGGDANQKHYQNDVWNSADGANWTRVAADVPWRNRCLHHTVAFNGRIWVMGGQHMSGFVNSPTQPTIVYDDIWHTPDGVNWEKLEATEPKWSPRGMIGNSAILHGRMWLPGGGTYDTPDRPTRQYFNDVWSSDDGAHWTCHAASTPWAPRQYHEIAAFDDKLWVLEGWDGKNNRNDVWYSEDGAQWQELEDTPWAIRHAASVFVHDDALWMVAGNNMESDVWRLDRV